jgi:hypothetical protein
LPVRTESQFVELSSEELLPILSDAGFQGKPKWQWTTRFQAEFLELKTRIPVRAPLAAHGKFHTHL